MARGEDHHARAKRSVSGPGLWKWVFAVKEPYMRVHIIGMLALAIDVAACETLPRNQDPLSVQSPSPDVNSNAVHAGENCSNGRFPPILISLLLIIFPWPGFLRILSSISVGEIRPPGMGRH
jgi:hypothetical protein